MAQIGGMFLSLFFKTNARARLDFYDRKQYRFCPHAPLHQLKMKVPQKGLTRKCEGNFTISSNLQ